MATRSSSRIAPCTTIIFRNLTGGTGSVRMTYDTAGVDKDKSLHALTENCLPPTLYNKHHLPTHYFEIVFYPPQNILHKTCMSVG